MQSKQLLLFIVAVLLLAGCRKDEFLAPPVDTIKAFEFSFMNPSNGRSKPIYDLNNENFLTYFLATNNTIEINWGEPIKGTSKINAYNFSIYKNKANQ